MTDGTAPSPSDSTSSKAVNASNLAPNSVVGEPNPDVASEAAKLLPEDAKKAADLKAEKLGSALWAEPKAPQVKSDAPSAEFLPPVAPHAKLGAESLTAATARQPTQSASPQNSSPQNSLTQSASPQSAVAASPVTSNPLDPNAPGSNATGPHPLNSLGGGKASSVMGPLVAKPFNDTKPTGDATTTATVPNSRGSRWGWRALVAFLAGALVMVMGFATSSILADRTPSLARVETVESSAGNATTELNATAGSSSAAGVAAALGPAVVQIETNVGLGSGVIYGDGLILTNSHVLSGASEVRVRLSDGRTLPAEVIGRADTVDVAVVSVGEGLGLPIAQLAQGEQVVVGQEAIAIGSPFELQQTVTQGIVSAVARPIQDPDTGTITAMIQTDASINPGNSGGALADAEGRVIGINTAIQTDGSAGSVGVGFAIPIDTVLNAADRLVAGTSLESGLLGVTGGPTTDGSAGVLVIEIAAGSGAEQAGVRVGDRIISFEGAPVTRSDELAGLVVAHPPGDVVQLEFVRGSETIVVEVTLGAR